MPEGPELATIKNSLSPVIGKRIASVKVGDKNFRKVVDKSCLLSFIGKRIRSVETHGKLLWLSFDSKSGIMFRLGMTGRLVVDNSQQTLLPHTHLRLGLDDGDEELRFIDARRFGEIGAYKSASLLEDEIKKLGPDPFSWTVEEKQKVAQKISSKSRAIKEILLDQSVLAGVGNIYASESLFESKIAPQAAGNSLSLQKIQLLLKNVEKVMKLALVNNGTTFSAYVDGTGKKGNNITFLKVFMRDGQNCVRCKSIIKRIVQSGRSTFYCAHCQQAI